jgi:hypothetical protein
MRRIEDLRLSRLEPVRGEDSLRGAFAHLGKTRLTAW